MFELSSESKQRVPLAFRREMLGRHGRLPMPKSDLSLGIDDHALLVRGDPGRERAPTVVRQPVGFEAQKAKEEHVLGWQSRKDPAPAKENRAMRSRSSKIRRGPWTFELDSSP